MNNDDNGNIIKRTAYKGFNVDSEGRLYCRDKYYKVGEVAEIQGKLEICNNGIHFCWELNNVYDFYNFSNDDVVVATIEVLGEIINDSDFTKSCSNKIKVLELLTKEQLLKVCNSGNWNSGNRNSGNWNSGNRNSGDWNSGNRNSGNWNSGNRNSGNRNSGDWNSGNRNSGDWNSGDWNSGDWNSGNWNSGDWNSGNWTFGAFNSEVTKIYLFNKPTDITMETFRKSDYYYALLSEPLVLTEWIEYTEEEKSNDKAKELIGGYLKTYSYKTACNKWWKGLSDENKKIIKNMPNFDQEVFTKITGIE